MVYLRVDFDEEEIPSSLLGPLHERRASLEYAIVSSLRSASKKPMNLKRNRMINLRVSNQHEPLTVAENPLPFHTPVDPRDYLLCITSRFLAIPLQTGPHRRVSGFQIFHQLGSP